MAMIDGALKGVIEGIMENPMVVDALSKLDGVISGVIKAMSHFNSRFDALETMAKQNSLKLDRILFTLENPSEIRAAGPDGLMQMLAENGQEMIMQVIEPMPSSVEHDQMTGMSLVSHESEVTH